MAAEPPRRVLTRSQGSSSCRYGVGLEPVLLIIIDDHDHDDDADADDLLLFRGIHLVF